MDLGIFQETEITDSAYTCRSAGHSVFAMDTPIRHHGGVAVFYWPSPCFVVEAVQKFGPNFVGFQL